MKQSSSDGMNLLDAVRLRSDALRRRDRSPRTIQFYEMWLRDLSRFLLIQDLDLIMLADLRRWVDGLIDRKLSTRSRIGAIVSAKVFFRWCVREKLLTIDPAERLEKPAPPRSLPQALEDYEVIALANAAVGTYNPQRDLAIVAMFVETGIRLGELVGLTPAQVLLPVDTITGWVIVSGKTGERFAPMNDRARQALEDWMRVRPGQLQTLFGLSTWGVRLMLKRLAKAAHIDPGRVHPHVLRHTSVAKRIENGAEAADLMNILGWTTTAMFPVYARLARERMMRRALATSPTSSLWRSID